MSSFRIAITMMALGLALGSPRAPAQRPEGFLWRSSCAASTCHGGVIGRGEAWTHSMTLWTARDPHARAGRALLNELSHAIVFSLDPQIAAKKKDQASLPDDQQTWRLDRDNLLRRRCLSCHATVTAAECQSFDQPLSGALLAEGVSCESCHGAAGGWIGPHITREFALPKDASRATIDKIRREKLAVGLEDTESVVGRAESCVRCHVGSRRRDGLVRDMNHDLIAAGHPVLRFDLLLYNESLPRHWAVSESDAFGQAPIEVRRAGRAVALSAAAELASQRAQDHAEQANRPEVPWPDVPWPEFSDHDCFACHQSLSSDAYRLEPFAPPSDLRSSAGLPIWNSWHTIGQQFRPEDAKAYSLTAKADRVAELGQQIAARYRAVARSPVETSPSELLQQVRRKLMPADGSSVIQPPRDWHEAAILYLDVDAALRQKMRIEQGSDDAPRQLQRLADEAGVLLQFRPEQQSPANFDDQSSKVFAEKILEILSQ
ncbi:MAG: cytochrome c family protein [Pirellulales bacterium]|nr:cytochrome c family protein [Pirellulales bacterium]